MQTNPLPLHVAAALLVCGLLSCEAVHAQEAPEPPVLVDAQGVMRWQGSGEEVALFGVNYTTPFAFAYRALGTLGKDRKQAIDRDVNHFARLRLDAFRVHVWDREVSDRQGNLLDNDHLDLLDYLIARLSAHGIKTILTPIAWWGTGYPERDPKNPGFSEDFSKGEMSMDPAARRAQVNYLKQFIQHRNPYTGRTYRDDPDILAIELFNEPDHPGTPEETTRFIDTLAEALRSAGLRKPIFYNISQGYDPAHGQAVCAADIQGVTGQWYPTGLVRGAAVQGNMLPNVDRYPTPFDAFPDCQNKARIVYEFDAADMAGSYLYPAMARSFRGAGFQWATQFAYDPLAIAYSNTEYQTHFLNLVYAPGKAISYMIAGEVFRRVPRRADFGTYPESARFGPFRVSYTEDLSEMAADTAFYYSNDTPTVPPTPASLRHVAGVGRSPVASYEGTGAYFLDRLEAGVWRLEVYPDAVWAEDPFTRPSLRREAVRLYWQPRALQLDLPDLGRTFTVRPINAGNTHRPAVEDGRFTVQPGVYLLTQQGRSPDARIDVEAGNFWAPPASTAPTTVRHTPPADVTTEAPFVVRALVAGTPPDSVALFVRHAGWSRMWRLPMTQERAYTYTAAVPEAMLQPGVLAYNVTVYENGQARTFPSDDEGHPYRWDFTGQDFWEVPVTDVHAPRVLFDARRDRNHLLYPHHWDYVRFTTDLVSGTMPGRLALRVVVQDFSPPPHHFAIRSFIPSEDRGQTADAGAYDVLRIRVRATERASDTLTVTLVGRDGTAWGAAVPITDEWQEVTLPLSDLQRMPLALLPRPYPGFMPYLFEAATGATAPDLSTLDGVQLSLDGRRLGDQARGTAHGFDIERIMLDRQPSP